MSEEKVLTVNTDRNSSEKLCVEKPWQKMFPEAMLEQAKAAVAAGKVQNFGTVWRGKVQARYYPDVEELKESGAKIRRSAGRKCGYTHSYYGYRYSYNANPFGQFVDTSREEALYYEVNIDGFPVGMKDEWRPDILTCSCSKSSKNRGKSLCVHEAAVLTYWTEQRGGLFLVEESDREYAARQREIQRRKLQETVDAARKEYGTAKVPALDFFQNRKDHQGLYLYDLRTALKERQTDGFSMHLARKILDQYAESSRSLSASVEELTSRSGVRTLDGSLVLYDAVTGNRFTAAEGTLSGSTLVVHGAEGYLESEYDLADGYYDKRYQFQRYEERGEDDPVLNAYDLVLCSLLWDKADQLAAESGDLTDEKADKFFRSLEKANTQKIEQAVLPEEPRRRNVVLYPRIIMENGAAQLSFRIAEGAGKAMVVKNVRELVGCCTDRTTYVLSKTTSIDFSKSDFTEDSLPLYQFIQRRIGEVHDANARIEQRNYYSVRTLTITSALDLKGALLDGFYDAWNGHTCEYTDKNNDIKGLEIRVGHKDLRFALTARKITDARNAFAGVAVEGLLPVLIEGSGSNKYVLNSTGLSRITKEEAARLRPFRSIADVTGYFRFQVGMDHLQEFYYRVVPLFVENPSVQFRDETAEEAEQYLPPEPQFDFFLDCVPVDQDSISRYASDIQDAYRNARRQDQDVQYLLTIRGEVSYEDKEPQGTNGVSSDSASESTADNAAGTRSFRLGAACAETGYRDEAQEKRVIKAINQFASLRFSSLGAYAAFESDDGLFDFLRSGIAVLERYGTVHGTDAFRTHAIRPVPQVKLGVSVESGVMDLSLTSQDLSEEDLLAVLQSYHLRKRYHRLSSGDYVDLTQENQLGEIGDLLAGLDLSAEEVIEKSAKVPLYRALYLDHLLEAHDDIVSSRDRVYRGLIRNFKTLKDSEIEPPASLENVLRPYQAYGFKWIKTLENAGFGGILADEMGLGKTLQMIAVLLSDYTANAAEPEKIVEDSAKEAGTKKVQELRSTLAPSLIVCPASLVYNWQEEFQKFAPSLTVRPVAGGVAARRKAWEAWDSTQVYIISYDLLKRHIAEIAEKGFYFVVLDEAQYIKNAGANAAKSVKALKATHRFALTGTPIENRLSELWSIFDFLMPGFLYSHTDFERKLEVPITKQKDEDATQRLRAMTGPFILRRRKEDVLKDLPAKLEEVRYVPISGEQQKLYDAQVLKVKAAIRDSDAYAQGAGTGNESQGTGTSVKAAEQQTGQKAGAAAKQNSHGAGSKIQVFAELTRIREICCDPSLVFENYHGESAKREACLALIQQAMDGGHRMLVFSQFTSMLALLEQDLQKAGIPYYILTGATPKEKRIQLVHDFNEGDTPVFLISLKAGGTGLNLTGADVVIHYDPWWNLAAQNQATDRTHRIGQTKQVTVYRIILKGTIEDRILELQESKKDLAESVLEGDNRSLSSLSSEELLELLG